MGLKELARRLLPDPKTFHLGKDVIGREQWEANQAAVEAGEDTFGPDVTHPEGMRRKQVENEVGPAALAGESRPSNDATTGVARGGKRELEIVIDSEVDEILGGEK